MSLRQRVTLEIEGRPEDVEVEYSAVDLRAWERDTKESALGTEMSVGMLTWLGWNAAVRQGLINGELATWETFDAVCTSVQGVRGEERPTKRAKGTRKDPGLASSAP